MGMVIDVAGGRAQLVIAARPLLPALPCGTPEIQLEIQGVHHADGGLISGVNAAFDDVMTLQRFLGKAQATLDGLKQVRLIVV
jgi:hypothetical protein